ncbi:hypothetical protein K502DRAFT_325543 [Neoconidiobolus thromboides FSU 785]|nr:hypothetical protein K502DRAFT_325543 [Neoconidiobolus thromboides FSU 785]
MINNKLIFSIFFASIINAQKCLRGNAQGTEVSMEVAPPCWLDQPAGLPLCFELTNGACPSWPGIYNIKDKKPKRKCRGKGKAQGQGQVKTPAPAELSIPVENHDSTPETNLPQQENKKQPKYRTLEPISPPEQKEDQPKYQQPEPIAGECNLPTDENIIPITPKQMNRGWAMSPDQGCKIGGWCPYACKAGYYSAQYDESARVQGPQAGSMNGGLKCEQGGKLTKPFADRPYCLPGMMNVHIDNRLDGQVSLCQTTYPGNEAMLIPTVAKPGNLQVINTPPQTYWQSTSAHYYVNPVNSSQDECIWGEKSKAIGNWAPFIVGSNEGFEGNTFVMITVNPEFISAGLQSTIGDYYKMRIECDDGACNGAPCEIVVSDPAGKNCVVTVPKNAKARVVFTH